MGSDLQTWTDAHCSQANQLPPAQLFLDATKGSLLDRLFHKRDDRLVAVDAMLKAPQFTIDGLYALRDKIHDYDSSFPGDYELQQAAKPLDDCANKQITLLESTIATAAFTASPQQFLTTNAVGVSNANFDGIQSATTPHGDNVFVENIFARLFAQHEIGMASSAIASYALTPTADVSIPGPKMGYLPAIDSLRNTRAAYITTMPEGATFFATDALQVGDFYVATAPGLPPQMLLVNNYDGDAIMDTDPLGYGISPAGFEAGHDLWALAMVAAPYQIQLAFRQFHEYGWMADRTNKPSPTILGFLVNGAWQFKAQFPSDRANLVDLIPFVQRPVPPKVPTKLT